jgi:hypothetical protein
MMLLIRRSSEVRNGFANLFGIVAIAENLLGRFFRQAVFLCFAHDGIVVSIIKD